MTIQVDFTGADRKCQALFRLDGAIKKQMTYAGAQIVKRAKRNVSGLILGGRSFRKTAQLARNIGMTVIETSPGVFELVVGTGIGTAKSVIYASVHEKGMTISAKRKKYLCFRLADGSWRMKKQVTIPARHWLWRSIQEESMELRRVMSPKELLVQTGFPAGDIED